MHLQLLLQLSRDKNRSSHQIPEHEVIWRQMYQKVKRHSLLFKYTSSANHLSFYHQQSWQVAFVFMFNKRPFTQAREINIRETFFSHGSDILKYSVHCVRSAYGLKHTSLRGKNLRLLELDMPLLYTVRKFKDGRMLLVTNNPLQENVQRPLLNKNKCPWSENVSKINMTLLKYIKNL